MTLVVPTEPYEGQSDKIPPIITVWRESDDSFVLHAGPGTRTVKLSADNAAKLANYLKGIAE